MTTPVLNIALEPCESSQIHSYGFDSATETLAVRFKDRATGAPTSLYHYSNFTEANFKALKEAESTGSHFYRHIKPFKDRFPYARIDESKEV